MGKDSWGWEGRDKESFDRMGERERRDPLMGKDSGGMGMGRGEARNYGMGRTRERIP